MHKTGSNDSISDLHKFVVFHLIENIPFDLSHTIYKNILHATKDTRWLWRHFLCNSCQQTPLEVGRLSDIRQWGERGNKKWDHGQRIHNSQTTKFWCDKLQDHEVRDNFTQREVPQVDEKESNKRPWECITHVLAAKDDALP